MGEIRAGNIHIEAEDVRNDGNIISENKTTIHTKKYSGSGNIISGVFKNIQKDWYSKPRGILFLGILASVIAGIILFFFLK
jgi:hypothetical protein